MAKPFYGELNKDNLERVATLMREYLQGQTFSIASAHRVDSEYTDLSLSTNCTLQSQWTDGSKEQIRVWVNDDYPRISFSAGHYFWTLDTTSDCRVNADRDGVMVEFRAPCGDKHRHLFKVQEKDWTPELPAEKGSGVVGDFPHIGGVKLTTTAEEINELMNHDGPSEECFFRLLGSTIAERLGEGPRSGLAIGMVVGAELLSRRQQESTPQQSDVTALVEALRNALKIRALEASFMSTKNGVTERAQIRQELEEIENQIRGALSSLAQFETKEGGKR